MDAKSTDTIIVQALEKAQKEEGVVFREKLRKLLIERQIPYIPGTTKIQSLRSLGHGVFGIVELIRYQKNLYAHKRPLQNASAQRNSILDEGIKLTDIAQHHPNIQRLHFINLRTFGLVIDYCSNGTLDEVVKKQASNYTLIDVLNWGYQLADALSFLHSKKIIHRDVKMENILLTDNYHTLVLTDYGSATQRGRSLMTNQSGTAITMAPEVIRGRVYGEQCDTYSWAIVFWQLISKQRLPFEEKDIGFIISVVQEKRRPAKLNDCPELFAALLYRSWHSDPNARPTLSVIKNILQVVLNALPKQKQEDTEEMVHELHEQWLNECN